MLTVDKRLKLEIQIPESWPQVRQPIKVGLMSKLMIDRYSHCDAIHYVDLETNHLIQFNKSKIKHRSIDWINVVFAHEYAHALQAEEESRKLDMLPTAFYAGLYQWGGAKYETNKYELDAVAFSAHHQNERAVERRHNGIRRFLNT